MTDNEKSIPEQQLEDVNGGILTTCGVTLPMFSQGAEPIIEGAGPSDLVHPAAPQGNAIYGMPASAKAGSNIPSEEDLPNLSLGLF